MKVRDLENKQPSVGTQAATDLIKAVSPIKEGMPKRSEIQKLRKNQLG
ncbi:MAG: hypothetical protein QW222_06970 [Candidatus Bathyarchaeia archaeon]